MFPLPKILISAIFHSSFWMSKRCALTFCNHVHTYYSYLPGGKEIFALEECYRMLNIPFFSNRRLMWAASAVRCRSVCVQQTDSDFVDCSASFTLRSANRFGFRRLFGCLSFCVRPTPRQQKNTPIHLIWIAEFFSFLSGTPYSCSQNL